MRIGLFLIPLSTASSRATRTPSATAATASRSHAPTRRPSSNCAPTARPTCWSRSSRARRTNHNVRLPPPARQRRARLDSSARAIRQRDRPNWTNARGPESAKCAGSPAKNCATNHQPERGPNARPSSDGRCATNRAEFEPSLPPVKSPSDSASRRHSAALLRRGRASRAGACAKARVARPFPLERGRGRADRGAGR